MNLGRMMEKKFNFEKIYRSALYMLFGNPKFGMNQESQEFKYRLLMVLFVFSVFAFGVFFAVLYATDRMQSQWRVGLTITHIGLCIFLWANLRNNHQRYDFISKFYVGSCVVMATLLVHYLEDDELRLIWFLAMLPSVIILHGMKLKIYIGMSIIAAIVTFNPYLSNPYSFFALSSILLCFLYITVFLYVYNDRMSSYLRRMRKYNAQLMEIAEKDFLTNTLNASAYYKKCEEAICLNKKNRIPYAVLFIDLDHFKEINDSHGHAAGDLVLQTVGGVLIRCLRGADLIGRVGGEEFSVFLSHTRLASAMKVAEDIRVAIEECRPAVDGLELRITASVGVATAITNDENLYICQQRADAAMYKAKKTGRNKVFAV